MCVVHLVWIKCAQVLADCRGEERGEPHDDAAALHHHLRLFHPFHHPRYRIRQRMDQGAPHPLIRSSSPPSIHLPNELLLDLPPFHRDKLPYVLYVNSIQYCKPVFSLLQFRGDLYILHSTACVCALYTLHDRSRIYIHFMIDQGIIMPYVPVNYKIQPRRQVHVRNFHI